MVNFKEIERDIVGDGYLAQEPWENLTKLCSFGSRFVGTKSEKDAVEYIQKKMSEYGLNSFTEEVEYLGWKRGKTKFEVTQPVEMELDCIGLPYTPSTTEEGVEAELLNLGNGTYTDFELHKDEVPGKIVMTTTFTPHWMRGQHRAEKLCRSENLGAAGFIYAKNDPGLLCETGGASWNPPEILGRVVDFPAVGTSREVAKYLGRLEKEGPVKVKITADNESESMVTWNVVGEIIGKEKPDEIIIAGAHFDGHDISVGAMDDAAGACVVMEAARLLARQKDCVGRTLRFITFPGEEVGAFGSSGYVLNHLDELDDIKFMFNLDGAGRASKPGVMVQGWPDSVPFFKGLSREMGQPMPVDVSFSLYSDHMPFALRGIHTASLRGSNSFQSWSGSRGWGHTKADTVDKVDIRDLREAAVNLARIILRMSNLEDLPFQRKSKDEIVEMLEHWGYREVMDILGSFPSWLK